MFCPSCGKEAPAGSIYCKVCGSVVDETLAQTRTSVGGTTGSSTPVSSAPSLDEERFLPGTMLDGRYRVVGLLGRGGMGEVYRADDLKLGQPVALKFLPAALADNQDRLSRLLHEVKIARQVSHPNVCRVYDVGETDGHHYLSMEYVDGEDLATLLRRIGRLPNDKALEIARQLCAGLAAAHEQGILHRDLKPANVMIDGRGRAKLTDFGLAGLAESIQGSDLSSGTPTYMAPEQLSGQEVSVRSDVYALGLVLYELFTGKRVFEAETLADLRRLQQESTPTSPLSFVDGFDPAVERVLFQCLDRQPAGRPPSALAVAAALPGGDPLAAALAAGETPSPEMVAAAGPGGGLRPWVANVCLAGIVLVLLATVWPAQRVSLYARVPFVKSFEALREDAREIARNLGYTDVPADTAAWLSFNIPEYFHQIAEGGPAGLGEAVEQPGQLVVSFGSRQSPSPIIPTLLNGEVSLGAPPPSTGEVAMVLNLQGHLNYLRAAPGREEPAEPATEEPDWAALFEAADLDIRKFEPTEVTRRPETYADARGAWTGVLPDHADRPVRIEAAALGGRPVYFEKIISSDSYWSAEEESDSPTPARLLIPMLVILLVLLLLLAGGALFLAFRSLRLGRGDRKGAFRIATAVFILRMLFWALGGDHAGHVVELYAIAVALCGAVTLGVMAWIVYVAFEPYVRRLWPEVLVSWSRLLAGRFRDPLVGRDVLIGCTAGMGIATCGLAVLWTGDRTGTLALLPIEQPFVIMQGGRFVLGQLFKLFLTQIWTSLGFMMLFLILRMVLRKTWIAGVAMCLLQGVIAALNFAAFGTPAASALGFVLGVVGIGIAVVLLVRFGLVALLAYQIFSTLLQYAPSTLDTTAPFFATGWFVALIAVALAIYGWRVSLAGRSLLGDSILAP